MFNKRIEVSKEEALPRISDKYKNLKQFLQNANFTYIAIDETSKELVFYDTDFLKRRFMILIPLLTGRKDKEIIFRDDLTDWKEVSQDYKVDIEECKKDYIELTTQIEKLGARLLNSCNGGNDYYEWYDLRILVKDFSVEKLTECVKLWDAYNDKLNKLIK